jgi:hypothetical protein
MIAEIERAKPQSRCGVQLLDDGKRVCSVHGEYLVSVPVSGEPKYCGDHHIESWMCPESGDCFGVGVKASESHTAIFHAS